VIDSTIVLDVNTNATVGALENGSDCEGRGEAPDEAMGSGAEGLWEVHGFSVLGFRIGGVG
jgi:hypothetical protein